jgi:hypothetical protein
MLYLISFFLSPLALLFAGKPIQALFNLVIYAFAWIGLFFFFVPGFICWGIGVVHALMVISSKKADRRADKIANAMRRTP